MSPLSRREFVRKTTLVAAATGLVSALRAEEKAAAAVPAPRAPISPGAAELRWLDGSAPKLFSGATWGVPWPAGKCAADASFMVRGAGGGSPLPMQSWPLAYWPDGSLKWTGHALPADASVPDHLELAPGTGPAPAHALTTSESDDSITIDTGVMQCTIAKSGAVLVPVLRREGREIARNGRLVCLHADRSAFDASRIATFAGEIGKIALEQSGPVRAVVKIEGRHREVGKVNASPGSGNPAERAGWLSFVVRLYFYAGGETFRVLHTLIHDGDEQKDFIRGLGIRFTVPMRGELHDRHVRFSGQEDGLFAEAVRGLTGLRRDPGKDVKAAQLAGRATPPVATWPKTVSARLQYVPAFSDWTLFQSSSDGFEIRKRTKEGFTWISAARGTRAGGLGYVGTPEGGLAFGIRNFWQSHPAQLDIRGAATDAAEVTAWLWAPEAGAMDLRGFHDGMGMDTYEKQLEGLEITYEDYEPGFDRPIGVARTSELFFTVCTATPERAALAQLAGNVRTPPVLVATPEYMNTCGVFGGLWTPVDRSTSAKRELEDKLDWFFDFYVKQQDERRWYGYWNYGDVMHSYDADRHEWKYDIGGFAWDNSELSTDLWLWLYFLRTGRADAFRFAEAMTRHTGEVDVHHVGRFAPLGSRHNVLHWGCSAKQLRISNAANRRYYYYLTADERVGDLMREQIDAARALATVQANRKVAQDLVTAEDPNATEVYAGFGTDWGSLAAAWLTEWERTGDPKIRDQIKACMETIARQPRGFFTGGARLNLNTRLFALETSDRINVSHLSSVFGLVEVCAELIQLIDVPEFKRAWLDYCELYNAPAEEQVARLGKSLGPLNLGQGHSRLTAYAARMQNDPALAARAWQEFNDGKAGIRPNATFASRRLGGTEVLRPVDEAAFVSTNAAAQWGLAAIQCLALVGDRQP
jgi:hypothetical protein